MELAVGDSIELEIIFLTGKRRGAQSKSPSIQTNEGPPQRRVTIRATVVQTPDSTYPITIKPYRIYVSRAGEVEVDVGKFNITNVSDQDLNVSVVGSPPGYFQVEIPETVKAGESAECKLKVNPEFLETAFEKSITLELSDAAQTRFTVPVIRRLIGAQSKKNTGTKATTTPEKGGGK
jgi:hypothetical protein